MAADRIRSHFSRLARHARSGMPMTLLALASALTAAPPIRAAAPPDPTPTRIELLGAAALSTSLRFAGTQVGGLSGIALLPESGTFLAISDDSSADPAFRGPARWYRLEIDLADGKLDDEDVRVVGVTEVLDESGAAIPPATVDLESIEVAPGNLLFITSEGQARAGIPPFLRQIDLAGRPLRSFRLPDYYHPAPGGETGVRFNQALESVAVTPDGTTVYTATENALAQDGPAATPTAPSPSRILRFDLASGELTGEFLYWTEPVAAPKVPPGDLETNGLVELLALDGETFLALERSYSSGVGFSIRLYRVSLAGAENFVGRPRLDDPARLRAATKTLLLDLADTGVELDNLEGLSWGPRLPDGRRSLVVIADNNFNEEERTLVLAFAVSREPVTLPAVQGRSHRSPLEGQWVFGAGGVVTGVLDPPSVGDPAADVRARRGLFLQDPRGDGDPATSDGVFVVVAEPSRFVPGDRVEVSGRVEESTGRRGELPITQLRATPGTGVRKTGSGEPLPAPRRVGTLPGAPHRAPVVGLDDDGLTAFDPDSDGLDFWESLEGMRVEVAHAAVTGPSRGNGEVVVVPDGGRGSTARTRRGGVRLAPGDEHPERLAVALLPEPPKVSGTSVRELPPLDVGDRFDGPLTGLLDYGFSNYRLLLTEVPPGVVRHEPATAAIRRTAAPGLLTLATWNVWNLDPTDGPERFARAAERIVHGLRSPDVIALEEVQDADGPADSGRVDGAPTFEALIASIVAAGGPRYGFRQIDPLDGLEGGEPGGNIRVGFLLHPERVTPVDRGSGDALLETAVEATAEGPRLTLSPGRVAPLDPAFAGDAGRRWGRSRRPLALEVRFGGETVFLIANHWSSKGGDDRLAGEHQPPHHRSEDQRSHQARLVAAFVEEILAVDPAAAVIVLGDLNEHEFRPPLHRLEAAGLTNLMHRLPPEERYTYNFEGNSQVLDHILVSPRLADGAEIEVLHTEADAAVARRASDHDPVLARLRVAPANP